MTRAHGVSFDRVADHYDQTRGGMARARIQAEAIVGLLPLPGPLLEVGVGTGLVAAAVREQGRDVVGVDLSPAMLARAARRLPGRVAVGSALRLPVATGSVAGCYLVHVLHLVADAAQALTEAARVLREGGVLVASANVTRPPDSDVAQVLHDMRRESGTRRQVFGERELLAAAGAAGLHLVRRVDVAQIYQGNSPRDAADRIRRRTMSWMWEVDDTVWERLADQALARLAALPDQDRSRSTGGVQLLMSLRPAGMPDRGRPGRV